MYKITFEDLYVWLKQSHNHWAWSHVHINISQRHIHEIHQRQDNHIIIVIQFNPGEIEETRKQPINIEHQRQILYQL